MRHRSTTGVSASAVKGTWPMATHQQLRAHLKTTIALSAYICDFNDARLAPPRGNRHCCLRRLHRHIRDLQVDQP
jgi:hypothetical protein